MVSKLVTQSPFFERNKLFGVGLVSNTVSVFLSLLLLTLPSLGFAQSDYYTYYTSGNTTYYPQYQQSYNLTQVASVAAAFPPVSVAAAVNTAPPQVENPPQLPRTGGGGRASEVKLKTSSFFIPMTAVFFLLLPFFFFFRVVSKNDNCL